MLQFATRPPFEKYIKKLKEKPLKNLFEKAVRDILSNPYHGQAKIGDLQGFWGFDVKYHGISYEIAYVINEDDQGDPTSVVFFMAGTRENFWEEIKKYIHNTK